MSALIRGIGALLKKMPKAAKKGVKEVDLADEVAEEAAKKSTKEDTFRDDILKYIDKEDAEKAEKAAKNAAKGDKERGIDFQKRKKETYPLPGTYSGNRGRQEFLIDKQKGGDYSQPGQPKYRFIEKNKDDKYEAREAGGNAYRKKVDEEFRRRMEKKRKAEEEEK